MAHRSIRLGWFAAPVLVLALSGHAARAASFSFSGAFTADDQLATFLIDLPAAGDISAMTLSYNGGTNGKGDVIPSGGFAPVLSLFDDTGSLVALDLGSSHTCGVAFCWDAAFAYAGALPGHYTLELSQDGNTPLGQLSDGFLMAGQPHYTADYLGGANPNATFVQVDGTQRTGQWALDLNAPGTVFAVPEPATAALLVVGLAMIGLVRLRALG